jgi:phosphonate degradation associated HDIG domain protein
MNLINHIQELFHKSGHLAYGEGVTELQHALQAAQLAEQDEAPDTMVTAALLHDVGHLLHGLPEDVAEQGIDGRHERIGEKWLARHFGPEVTQPVRLHVDAKRHQCTVHPEYLEQLSPASAKSFELQGGKMNADELAAFEQNPFFKPALRLRKWDDQAKDPEKATPDLEQYLPLVKGTLVSAPASQ